MSESIPFEITRQGAPVVTDLEACVYAKSDNILCLDIDLGSKHCEEVGESGTEIYIDEGDRTIHPESGPGGEGITGIRFHTLRGWQIYQASVCRYTLRVTLIKEKP